MRCPIHGNELKQTINLNFANSKKYSRFGNVQGYFCDKCNTCYINTKGMRRGIIGNTLKGIKIYNIHKYIFLPQSFTIITNDEFESRKKSYVNISAFYSKDYEEIRISSLLNNLTKEYFISLDTYVQNMEIFENRNVKFQYNDDIKRIISNHTNYFEYESSDKDSQTIDFNNLKQNNKVAIAYTNSNIKYNPYQYLPWLYMYNEGNDSILITDEVGLGKTVEAGILIAEELNKNTNTRILVICPAFLKNKWKNELYDKFYLKSAIFDLDDFDSRITILPLSKLNKFNKCNQSHYDMIIIDEAHYFKNNRSARYHYLYTLINNISPKRKVFMTATPINNKDEDYYSIERLMGEDFPKTSTTKRQAYIHIAKRIVKEVYVDLTPYEQEVYNVTDSLDPFSGTIYRHIGASCLYALTKYAQKYSDNESDVKTELRDSLEELLDYEYVDETAIEDMGDKLAGFHLDGIDSKLNQLMDLINNIEDNKIVIFSHYIETVKYLKSELSKKYNCEYIYGNNFSNHTVLTNKKNRFIDAKYWFDQQSSNKKTILICSDTCKEGIDLDAASCLINYDLPFNPSILEQRIGRIDRMCQKKDMKIFNFHVNYTYDDRLHMILSSKLLIIDYFSEYGIGNPLAIVENDTSPFDKFISYFKKNNNISMTNDDFTVIKKILRKIGKQTSKNIKQDELLNLLIKYKDKIISLFNEQEIDKLTDDQLTIQKALLDKKLGFPKFNLERMFFDVRAKRRIVELLTKQPSLRIKLSSIIIDYDSKMKRVEDTGEPMYLDENDIQSSIMFSSNVDNNHIFISRDTVNLLKEQGAIVHEN